MDSCADRIFGILASGAIDSGVHLSPRHKVKKIRVLMIGKSEAMMQKMVLAMGLDFARTVSENTPEVLQTYNDTAFDVVILGRALPEDARAVLRNKLQKEDQALMIVKSLGPFGELVGAKKHI